MRGIRRTSSSRARSASDLRGLLPLLLIPLLVGTAWAAADPARMTDGDLRRELGETLQSGELVRAGRLCDELRRRHPDDPLLAYNAACLAARTLDTTSALEALEAAVAGGYDDLHTLETDGDLAPLHGEPRYRELTAALRRDLDAHTAEAARSLTFGEPVALGDLYDWNGEPAGFLVTLSADALGLRLHVDAPAGAFEPDPAPWYRGGGLVFTVTAPAADETYDAARAWRFGYGIPGAVPAGAVLTQPGRRLDQVVLELAPRLDWDPASARRVLEAELPWAYLAPYAPPLDLRFGVNLEWVDRSDEGRLRRYRLVEDPAGSSPDPGLRRRHLLLDLVPVGASPLLHGAVSSTVAGTQPLEIAVEAWSPAANAGVLEIEVTDNAGTSVVSSGGTAGRIELASGLNAWERQADLSGLPMGPYRLTATLVLDDGRRLVWHAGLFRFGSDWLRTSHDRTKALPLIERPAVQYRLDLIRTDLEQRDRRASPAPLMDTVAEVESLLRIGETAGTLLTPGETVILALDAGGSGWLPVRLQLPLQDTGAPVLLLLDADGRNGAALQDALRDAAPGARLTALPSLAGRNGRWTPQARQEAVAVVDWLTELFPGRRILAVTADGVHGEATRLATARPGQLAGVWEETLPRDAAAAAAAVFEWAAGR